MEDFKTRFIMRSFINQYLIDKHYTTNPQGITVCTTCLTALDPTIYNPIIGIPSLLSLKCILNFPYGMESITPHMRYSLSQQNVLVVVMTLNLPTPLTLMNVCAHQCHMPPLHLVTLIGLLSQEPVLKFMI